MPNSAPPAAFSRAAKLAGAAATHPLAAVLLKRSKWRAGRDFQLKGRPYLVCCIDQPETGVLSVGEQGTYATRTTAGQFIGSLYENSKPATPRQLLGDFRRACAVAGRGYAVGQGAMVYRLDEVSMWARIDEGLDVDFDAEVADGWADDNLYVVGDGGLWHFDGGQWTVVALPCETNLGALKCTADGTIYVGGSGGVLLRYQDGAWQVIDHRATNENIVDLEWHAGRLYVCAGQRVFEWADDRLNPVDFGAEAPRSCSMISSFGGVLLAVGAVDMVALIDGAWHRVA